MFRTSVARLVLAGIPALSLLHAAQPTDAELDRKFNTTVRPFVAKYCAGCHSGATPAAQLDLKSFGTVTSVVHDFPHWNLLADRLTNNEMPPKVAPQPPAADRKEVVDWVHAVAMNEARKNAGDPGIVLLHRLSNSEYNNTIRDLTGIDMRPAREFPVDPANTAGFDNSGETLSMSPSLLKKYLEAAREVGDHMVLSPDSIDFATHPMLVETDREKYAIQRIVNFYKSQPTDYSDYFLAAWRYKHRDLLGRPKATLAQFAAELKLSQKYMPLVWDILEKPTEPGKPEVGPVAKLQKIWHEFGAGTNDEDIVRADCDFLRNWVITLRKHTAMEFTAPTVRGLSPTSQPLMNWKFRQFNSHRRNFDPEALRAASAPPLEAPAIGRYPGLGQESAPRAHALMLVSRVGDADLIFPEGQKERYEASFARFANVFPDVFYISERGRYFPDDSEDKGRLLSAGYHNVMGYWRDDTPLMELILDEKGQQRLNRLWDEFDFISDFTAHTYVQYYFNQSGEVMGNGRESGTARPPDKDIETPEIIFGLREAYLKKAEASNSSQTALDAIKYHFQWVNDTLRRNEKMRLDAEPHHLDALLKIAARAWRRPLTPGEHDDILAYYRTLREKDELTHEEAIRDSIVRVLMSPKFCYHLDLTAGRVNPASLMLAAQSTRAAKSPAATAAVAPLSAYALANRLSYFLWASMPDEQLLAHAASGDLLKPDVLVAQTHRMLKDPRSLGLVLEFGGNWLSFRRFEDLNSVDRERFPTFTNELREAMFQEPVHFLQDLVVNDRSVLNALYGNYTFVNPVLAQHYGIPGIKGDDDHWVRVENAEKYGRGGILPMAAFLTMNAPGLRTSPVKRGHWVVKEVLGEVIPPPPAVVPELPHDEAKLDLPLREVLAKHRENALCAGCHARFDSLGLAMEGYGPVGERRTKDLAGHQVDTEASFPGGGHGIGLEGIEAYIKERRQQDFLDNLSRKLLAYALGRSLMLSDELAIDQMRTALSANGYRFSPIVDIIVKSAQFRNKRGPGAPEQRGE